MGAEAIAAARAVMRAMPGYAPTPLRRLEPLARRLGLGLIALKDESERFGIGSFKALGAGHALALELRAAAADALGRDVTIAELLAGSHVYVTRTLTAVCASDGNHGRALAWAASLLGCRSRVYLPTLVSPGRRRAIADLGAEMVAIDGTYDDAVAAAAGDARRHGWIELSDTAAAGSEAIPIRVMQGYGVMVDEIASTAPKGGFTHVFVQAGVGGMAAAVLGAAPLYPALADARGIVVESTKAACLLASIRAGRMQAVPGPHDTIMCGLACGVPSTIAWRLLQARADAFIAIDDDDAVTALRLLASGEAADVPLRIGESGAAGLAALLTATDDREIAHVLGLDATSRILLIGSEGITDPETYASALAGGGT